MAVKIMLRERMASGTLTPVLGNFVQFALGNVGFREESQQDKVVFDWVPPDRHCVRRERC